MYYNVITLSNINLSWNLFHNLNYYWIYKPLKTRYSGTVYWWAVLLFVLYSSLDELDDVLALLPQSSPCVVIWNTHLYSCVAMAFCCLQTSRCHPLPLSTSRQLLPILYPGGSVRAALASGMVRVSVVPHLELPEQVSSPVRDRPHSILRNFGSCKPSPLQIGRSAVSLAKFSLELGHQLEQRRKFHVVLLYICQTTVCHWQHLLANFEGDFCVCSLTTF